MQPEAGLHLLQWRNRGISYSRQRKILLLLYATSVSTGFCPGLNGIISVTDSLFTLYCLMIFWWLGTETGFCPSHWIPYNGHCFFLNRTKKTWLDAQRECRKEGGDLVSMRNIEDQSFVMSQLGYGKWGLYLKKAWLGGLSYGKMWQKAPSSGVEGYGQQAASLLHINSIELSVLYSESRIL